jgi:hypothetical protein
LSLLDWSTNAANNTSKPGIDWSEGQLPSTVNGSARAMMADVASWLQAPVLNGNTTINGAVSATGAISRDSAFYLDFVAGLASIAFDAGDYLGYSRVDNVYRFHIAGGAIFAISSGGAGVSGAFNVTGAITQNGNQVWHAGNFNPSNYATTTALTSGLSGKQNTLGYTPANKAGDTFTGAIRRDANFYLDFIGGNPAVAFANGVYVAWNGTRYVFYISGSPVFSIGADGIRTSGNVFASTTP